MEGIKITKNSRFAMRLPLLAKKAIQAKAIEEGLTVSDYLLTLAFADMNTTAEDLLKKELNTTT